MSALKKRKVAGNDATSSGAAYFQWLIHPCTVEEFYHTYWEKQPLIVSRKESEYYENSQKLFVLGDLKRALKEKELEYGRNIDITNYRDGKRVTLNEDGEKITYDHAMKRFEEKCTLRVLHPQEFSDDLYKACALLQEWFGCVVGSNVYITPADAQGFAPHYDDVDVFIIQTEGRKLWKLYNPISEDETLPEVSSRNFGQDEIGECIKEVWLEKGDMMYFPRGVIHQAVTDKTSHSTHITISTVQKWTWYHYLMKALPLALRSAFEDNIEYRKVLPRHFQNYMGIMYSDEDSPQRNEFAAHATMLAQSALEYLPLDPAADLMWTDYLHDSLPPLSLPNCNGVLTVIDKIRLVSKTAVRITCEGESIFFYYNTKNTRIYHEIEPQFIEFPLEASDALEYIINSFPSFISIDELPLEFDEDKLEVSNALVAAKILLVQSK